MTNVLNDTVQRTIDGMQPRQVYAEPIERDGVVFLAAAKVRGGGGGGGDAEGNGGAADVDADDEPAPVEPIGDDAGGNTERYLRRHAGRGDDAHHERRTGELEREPAERELDSGPCERIGGGADPEAGERGRSPRRKAHGRRL